MRMCVLFNIAIFNCIASGVYMQIFVLGENLKKNEIFMF